MVKHEGWIVWLHSVHLTHFHLKFMAKALKKKDNDQWRSSKTRGSEQYVCTVYTPTHFSLFRVNQDHELNRI